MGTITARKRQDGSMAFRAGIHLKQNGRTVHKESKTFDRRPTAKARMARREKELREPGGLEAAQGKKGTLDDLIGTYLQKMLKSIGRTKAQCLNTMRKTDLARMNCEDIRSPHIVEFATKLGEDLEPSTVTNYMSHLSAVIRLGRPAWGYPIDHRVMSDARTVTDDLGVTGCSKVRDRRPTREELDLLMAHFVERSARGRASPMEIIVPFAIFSTRRQSEISAITWTDYEVQEARYMVRDMKHAGQKLGNDVWCDAPPDVLRILNEMPRNHKNIFPDGADGISKAFTKACKIRNIDDLHFHDLRHEGVSRLFEMGMTIPFVAMVSGHRSWQSLKRYTNLFQNEVTIMKGESGGQPSRRQRETCRNRCDTGVTRGWGKTCRTLFWRSFFPTILAADEPRIDLRATPLTQSEGARTWFSTKNRTFGT